MTPRCILMTISSRHGPGQARNAGPRADAAHDLVEHQRSLIALEEGSGWTLALAADPERRGRVTCDPSDALAPARRGGTPIYVSVSVFSDVSAPFSAGPAHHVAVRPWLERIGPEDSSSSATASRPPTP